MPFCPRCRQEYEVGATTCADCSLELVPELPPERAPGVELALVLAEDEAAAEAFREAVAETGVPIRPLDEPPCEAPVGAVALLVPGPFLSLVLKAADASPALERDAFEVPAAEEGAEPEVVPLLRARVVQVDARPDLEPLTWSREEVLRRGAAAIPGLLEIVARGAPEERARAVRRLLSLGGEGTAALAEATAGFAREGRREALYFSARELADRRPSAERLAALLAVACDPDLDPGRRALALHALGRIGVREVGPRLVDLLADPAEIVREEADEALCTLTDEDMGFHPDLDPEEVARVQRAWREWFAKASS